MTQVTIPTWQERLGDGMAVLFTEQAKAMQAEIDDLRAALQAAPAQGLTDGERYRAIIGMSSEQMLRLYNTRPDLREAFIDAAIRKGQQS